MWRGECSCSLVDGCTPIFGMKEDVLIAKAAAQLKSFFIAFQVLN
jgi:hypothetical protein